jgi:hypothetical protein
VAAPLLLPHDDAVFVIDCLGAKRESFSRAAAVAARLLTAGEVLWMGGS